ncbi:glycoside hydrolase family 52 protein [Sorangium sp. So ce1182]|uniref:glycoside hydrolase family 52 protein n=1 Tax=Sorangium sp. So ce1182 TaxID=3133334 RepID=UPI003F5FF7C6
MSSSSNYNVQHAPVGAFASFTLGSFDRRGGFASQVGRPGNSNLYIGYREGDGVLCLLPYFESAVGPEVPFGVTLTRDTSMRRVFGEQDIRRELGWASDTIRAGKLTLAIFSPFGPIPDPRTAKPAEVAQRSCPALIARLELDNTGGTEPIKGLFALDASSLRDLESTTDGRLAGVAHARRWGFAALPEPGVRAFQAFGPENAFDGSADRLNRLGKTGGLVIEVPAGEKRELWIALGFHDAGAITTGIEARYAYTRYFNKLEDVLAYALEHREALVREAAQRDEELSRSALSRDQKWLLAQATHGYFGSTEWLDTALEDAAPPAPLWVVNEGEYEMMNTFDLTIDHLFFELRYAAWAVRDVLDLYVDRYSYRDKVKRPGAPGELLPGGVAFTHDMGVGNHFSPAGVSSYERPNLDASCFSHMTYEQLTNWICCAGVYVARTGDKAFLERHKALFSDLLESLLRRDAPEPGARTGVMSLDSSRCGTGAEITTYDSLDHSLGRARGNLYLVGKTWASYVVLAHLLERCGDAPRAAESRAASHKSARAIAAAFDEQLGYIPALLDGSGSKSAIVPAIEGLLYPHAMGLLDGNAAEGEHGELIRVLRRHLNAVLKPGLCLFPEGGWKLSSSSDNSWASKIALCQHVARAILKVDLPDPDRHEEAHVRWQIEGSGYWAYSDQMQRGVPVGSRYYPRGVTAILWLDEAPAGQRSSSR